MDHGGAVSFGVSDCPCHECRTALPAWKIPGDYAVVNLGQNPMRFTTWHPTRELAEKEAERLAIKEGGSFAVVQRIGTCAKAPLVRWDYRDQPF